MGLLLLAGTGEARQIATALAGRKDVIASLAGSTRMPAALGVPTRIGGFGGDQGFTEFLRQQGITAVLDATHPFAARVSARTARICAEMGIAHLHLLRPPWTAGPGDNWHLVAHERDVARIIPQGARVFLATGRQRLADFAGLQAEYLFCRLVDRPDAPFPRDNGEYVIGKAPFSPDDEVALFRRLRIDWLVVRNAGGTASRAKLDAARALGLKVAMIERPHQPACNRVQTVEQALAWLHGKGFAT